MLGGYIGKLLRVNLTEKEFKEEPLREDLIKKFIGMIGFGVKILYDEAPPEVGAYDPENRLIFMTGPFTGVSQVQSPACYAVITKNPLLPVIAIGTSKGYWGPRLKFAGYDGLIIEGKSDKPIYLWIHDEACEFRSAESIWGKDTLETEDMVKEYVGERKASVACIGPAGENLCSGAMIENDKGHVASKNNVGTVMGSKNLKAIAVYGTKKIPIHNPEELRKLGKEWREKSFETAFGWLVNYGGTGGAVAGMRETGMLPAKNLTTGIFGEPEDYAKISGDYLRKTFKIKPTPCFGCSLNHVHEVEVTEGPYKGFVGDEPEYEGIAAFGSMIGVKDLGSIVMLNDYADRLGIDLNWAASALGFAIEAYEKGIITKKDTDGLELRWGDEKAAKELLRRIAYREGIGDTLAMGLKRAAEKIGGKALEIMVHIKGEPFRCLDARGAWGMFLGHCIAVSGTRWESLGTDSMPDPELGLQITDSFSPEGKPEAARLLQLKKLGVWDTGGACWFGVDVGVDLVGRAYAALTGLPAFTLEEGLLVGERITNLQRAFNIRHGYKSSNDLDVSPRLLEPPPDGGAKGKTIAPYLEDLISKYYELMGWDTTGKPLKTTLEKLDLKDVAEDLK